MLKSEVNKKYKFSMRRGDLRSLNLKNSPSPIAETSREDFEVHWGFLTSFLSKQHYR